MSRARGFTLVEVLVALTILSMMMVATITALRAFANTKTTIKQVSQRVDELRVVSGFLRNSIGSAMPVQRVGAFNDSAVERVVTGTYFWGTPTEIIWVSPMVMGASSGGALLMRMTYVESRVELQWHPYEPSVGAFNWSDLESRILLTDVDEFEIGYLPAYDLEWTQQWAGSARNPAAVRLNMRVRDRYWPEILLRLDAVELIAQ